MRVCAAVLGCMMFSLLVLASCGRPGSSVRPPGQTPAPALATPSPRASATAARPCNPATQWRPPADNVALNDLVMVAPDEGWVVGNTDSFPFDQRPPTGVLYHLAQGQLVRLPQTYPGARLVALSMDSPSDGWAVSDNVLNGTGDRAVVLHYHLGQWSLVDIPALDAVFKGPPGTYGGNLEPQSISVRMFGPDAGWIFAETNIPRELNNPTSGPQVVILRYEGGVWTPIAAPAVSLTTSLFALSAVSADEAWIVGTEYDTATQTTLFAHFVHGAWNLWPRTFPGIADWLTMLSPTDGWAAYDAAAPILLHYNGTAWAPASLPPAFANQGVKISPYAFPGGAGDLWFNASSPSGDLLEEYANGTWRQFNWPYADAFAVAMTATSPTELWGIGDVGHTEGCPPAQVSSVEQGALLHFQQGHWTEQILP